MPPTTSGAARFCANCGDSVGPATRFCSKCGAAQSPAPQVRVSGCRQCGVPLDGKKFCASCGTPAESTTPTPSWRKLDMSDFREKQKKEMEEKERQFSRAQELAAAKRAAAEAKFAQLERESLSRPRVQPPAAPVRAASLPQKAQAMRNPCRECGQEAGSLKFCANCGASTTKPVQIASTSPVRQATTPAPPAVTVVAQMICAQCNTPSPLATCKFCAACGAKFVPKQPTVAAATSPAANSTCKNCGTNAPGMKFCPECGTALVAQARTTSTSSVAQLADRFASQGSTTSPSRADIAAATSTATAVAAPVLSNPKAVETLFTNARPVVSSVSTYASSNPAAVSTAASMAAPILSNPQAVATIVTSAQPVVASVASNSSSSRSSVASKYLSAVGRNNPSSSAALVASAAPTVLPYAASAASSSASAFKSRPTGSGASSGSGFVPPVFVPPQDGSGHVYTMTQTVTRSVTYNG